ncbi:hypothetical protein [Acidovorax sp. NB1]|uniref:hypothetical protein n=1 Tax=Acidovorax sp. NB1 TaxID=1943571 RepID=UPI0010DBD046|nr:hypothetical protein [Acidovorax sp. NB1]GDY34698.1 hypothetical protein ACINB_05900 [Acidovorax sp. NB1]
MNRLNNDDNESQRILAWFNKSDENTVKSALYKIADSNPELDKQFSTKFTANEYELLFNSNRISGRIAILIGAILGLIDPFMAQTSIAENLREKAKSILASGGINTLSYNPRAIEMNNSELKTIFSEII